MNILKPHTLTLKPVKNVNFALLPEFLGELAQIFAIDGFVETGTFWGNTAAAACDVFQAVHTIELSHELYRAARQRFSETANCHVYQGDSAAVLTEILPRVEGRILLWLDAHYSQGNTARGEVNTPILAELEALKQSGKTDAIILIDDVRHFQPAGVDTSQSPSLQGYPTLRQIQDDILAINRNYQFAVLGDLALAYPAGYAVAVSPLVQACTVSRLFDDGDIPLAEVLAAEATIGAARDEERSAIEMLARSILGSGDDSPVGGHYRLWYGLTLAHQKRHAEAYREFMQAFERGCLHWRVFWYLAQAAKQMQRYDLARKAIRLVTDAAADFQPAQSFLKQISGGSDNFGSAGLQSASSGYARVTNSPKSEDGHFAAEKSIAGAEQALGHGIVFSKDRAMQLDALLHSFWLHCQDADRISLRVLYTTSSALHAQQYQQLISEYPTVQFQKERDFQTDLLRLLDQSRYVLFLVDDTIFVRDFSIAKIIETLDQIPAALGFSLRLGRNTTHCYMAGVAQNLPEFKVVDSETLEYDWTAAGHDFGYPLEVSSSVYRSQDLLPLLTPPQFSNPNTLELQLAANKTVYQAVRRRLLCFSQSVAFSAPVNIVQTAWRNKAGSNAAYSPESLASLYETGWRIDVTAFSGFVPDGVHQETPLEFRRLNQDVSRMSESAFSATPAVSVVIITYNRSRWLGEAIQSALNQTQPVDEILVIDDGSPGDAAGQVVRSFSDRRVRYIKKAKNEGRPSARNTGIEQASGNFILWLDDDDLLLPQTAQHYLALLRQQPALEIVYGKLRYFTGEPRQLGDIYDPLDWFGKTADLLSILTVGSAIPNPGALVKRSLYPRIGGYDPHFRRAEDYEFWTRAAGATSMKKLDQFVCLYRVHPDNVSFGDMVDLSYESSVIRALVERHGLPALFPDLDWSHPQRAEAAARLRLAKSFLKYDDQYNAVKVLEPVPVAQLTPDMVDILAQAYLFMTATDQLNHKLPLWAATPAIGPSFVSRYTALVDEYRALLNRASQLLSQHNFTGAQAVLEQGRRQYGNTADVLVLLAQAARQQGDDDRAFGLMKKAVHCAPIQNGIVQLALSLAQSESQRQEILDIQHRLLASADNALMESHS